MCVCVSDRLLSVHTAVQVSQQLCVLAGGVQGQAPGTLQEGLVQQVGGTPRTERGGRRAPHGGVVPVVVVKPGLV